MVVKRHLAAATAVFVALGAGAGLAVAQEASQSPVQTTAPSAAPQSAPGQTPVVQGAPVQTAGATAAAPSAVQTIPGMPPVINPANLYSETTPEHINPEVAQDPARVYVPNLRSNDVSVIDPATSKVVDRFPVGKSPQHVVPSWDLRTLWVTNNAEGTTNGSLTPIDARTAKPGPAVAVDDPYNMYFTPDGKSAIVVAEARKRLDFRDPHTMALQQSVETPDCKGVNHA
ncbi:MAG: YncE family protein, partial [Acetobacter persici]